MKLLYKRNATEDNQLLKITNRPQLHIHYGHSKTIQIQELVCFFVKKVIVVMMITMLSEDESEVQIIYKEAVLYSNLTCIKT